MFNAFLVSRWHDNRTCRNKISVQYCHERSLRAKLSAIKRDHCSTNEVFHNDWSKMMSLGDSVRNMAPTVARYFDELDLFEIETSRLEGFYRQLSIIAIRIYTHVERCS